MSVIGPEKEKKKCRVSFEVNCKVLKDRDNTLYAQYIQKSKLFNVRLPQYTLTREVRPGFIGSTGQDNRQSFTQRVRLSHDDTTSS